MIVLGRGATGCRLPIKIWSAKEETDGSWVEENVLAQFRNLANHPLAFKWVCGMPDFHIGYGMPIGGVLATQAGVIPNAVGVDIGCGMAAARTDVGAADVTQEQLEKLRQEIYRRVPVGFKHHEDARKLPDNLVSASAQGLAPVVAREFVKAKSQIGTLGSGNHFIEIQKDEVGQVWIMLHSGSRNVGKQVCDHYDKVARKYMERFHSDIPDRELAFLPRSVAEYGEYMNEMTWCLSFAEHSRALMLDEVCMAFKEVLGMTPALDEMVDTHHNYAAWEHHWGQNLLIHRKGAVRAKGRVTIPGSMGTASYIGEGLEELHSFHTCSHGAGRAMGRKEANRTISHEDAVASMSHVTYGVRTGRYDEMPMCYKPIDEIMEAQAELVRPVHRLVPLAVVKG
jgi:tRNA-splicing ligase RtcB